MLRKLSVVACAFAMFVGAVGATRAARADTTTLKIGTLAPKESPWGQVFTVWQKGVKERSGGAVELQFFWNGTQGDEVAMVGKIRTSQLDGAAITATGLAQIYKGVLVMQLPGLFPTWEKLDKARNTLKPQFDGEFEKAGFKILGWGDVGIGHLMSKGFDVKTPADLKHKNAFFIAGDPIEPMVYSLIGDVTPKQLTVPEILPALTSNTVNVVNAPALVAEQLQWASRLDHLNTAPSGVGIGALIFGAPRIKGLPADVQTMLLETGKVAGDALTGRIRREDSAAYGRLKARMTAYEPTAAEMAEWQKLFESARGRLKGTYFAPAVFDAAVAAAQ